MNKEMTQYMDYLFSAALKKTGDIADAEDLTQEVMLAALSYLRRGEKIENMQSWLLSTLNHKWNDMLRKKYRLPTVSIDTVPDIPEEEIAQDDTEASQVRREVAYLARLQREVIVMHYFQGKKIADIAEALDIPKGTVLSRLSSGREQMKKGMKSMEQYEKQSYMPERLDISCHGRPGIHNEPWSLVIDDLMKQNILIIAYERPVRIIEIAKALGIPTPYIENAVEDLVHSELMCRMGDKVFSDFMINTPAQVLKGLDVEIDLAEEQYAAVWPCVEELFHAIEDTGWYRKLEDCAKISLKYYAMLDIFSRGIYTACKRFLDTSETYPARPDGGAWIAVGNRYPMNFDFGTYRFSRYCYGGERRAYWEHFLGAGSIDLHVYDTQPDLNRYQHGPIEMSDDNLCKLLYIIHREIPFDETGFNSIFLENIPHLVKCGVLRYVDARPCVAIPVVDKAEYNELLKLILTYMNKLADILELPLREAAPKMKYNIPQHLEGRVAESRQYGSYAIPMVIVKRAIANGAFLRGVKGPTPPMLLVIDC